LGTEILCFCPAIAMYRSLMISDRSFRNRFQTSVCYHPYGSLVDYMRYKCGYKLHLKIEDKNVNWIISIEFQSLKYCWSVQWLYSSYAPNSYPTGTMISKVFTSQKTAFSRLTFTSWPRPYRLDSGTSQHSVAFACRQFLQLLWAQRKVCTESNGYLAHGLFHDTCGHATVTSRIARTRLFSSTALPVQSASSSEDPLPKGRAWHGVVLERYVTKSSARTVQIFVQ
jgi:hypothetical protein